LLLYVLYFCNQGNCDEEEDDETNTAMQHGIKMESVIQEAYQLLTGNKTRESGYWEPLQQDILKGLVGASPDAIMLNKIIPKQNVAVCEFKVIILGMLFSNYLFSTTPHPVCCHLFMVGGLCTLMTRIAMLAGVFILLLGPPKPDRLKDRGQTK